MSKHFSLKEITKLDDDESTDDDEMSVFGEGTSECVMPGTKEEEVKSSTSTVCDDVSGDQLTTHPSKQQSPTSNKQAALEIASASDDNAVKQGEEVVASTEAAVDAAVSSAKEVKNGDEVASTADTAVVSSTIEVNNPSAEAVSNTTDTPNDTNAGVNSSIGEANEGEVSNKRNLFSAMFSNRWNQSVSQRLSRKLCVCVSCLLVTFHLSRPI